MSWTLLYLNKALLIVMNNQFLSFLGVATSYFYKINSRSQTIGFYELRGLLTVVIIV